MNKFDDRKKSFEKKFVIDEELQFKVAARSNKYLGEWISIKVTKTKDDTKKYIQELIKADMEEPGTEDVFRKIKKIFEINQIAIEDSEIRIEMEKALTYAKEDLK